MKRINLVRTFVALALLGTVSACLPVHPDPNGGFGADGKLALNGTVSEATIVTRATTPSAAELKEKDLNTLDVFVEHVGDEGKFMKQYHLVGTTDAPIQEQVNNLLAEHWQNEGLEYGEKYNIYVAANNSQTKGEKNLATFGVTALKRLMVDEVAEGIAVLDDDGNIGWGTDTTSGNIFKLYDANPGSGRALTKAKEFMMDGVIENWTPDQTTRDQVFNVTLNRAAAKFVVNVKFDADFLTSLEAEGASITGSPAWKFYNFAFDAPVFAPATLDAGIQGRNSGFNIFHNQSCEGGKAFTITTYSYPNKWDAAKYATDAPSLVISIGFIENEKTNYHYYRIPLVPYQDEDKNPVTEIERNHIYAVTATIATKGSATQVDPIVTEDINYAVLPWNDQSNSDVIENNVQSVQHYYFNVNPKVYTLRGDGDQSIILHYSKATGTKVNWKLFTYDADGNQTGVVAKGDANAVRAWFYDADGEFTTSYGDSNQDPWPNMGVTITQSTEGTSGSKGTVTVTSKALSNKGIKYIRLRVYLDEEETFDDSGKETMYQDIIIRHFPTDNIQGILGSWSSYHDPNSSSSTTIYRTTDLAEAQALATQYGISYSSQELTEREVINYATYTAHSSEAGYAMEGPQTVTRQAFAEALTSNDNRRNANSQANAILSDGWYYWGENPSAVANWWNDNDYYTRNYGSFTYYIYQVRYRARYTHTYNYTEYILELPIPSTGNWVDWDAPDAASHTGQRTFQYSYTNNNNSRFYAKVYNSGHIYYINDNRVGGYGSNTYRTEQGDDVELTNNHMYVIQISSTSDDYVLGRPYVNSTTHQSQDDVVSPAFMIASQLGAVTQFTGNNAARNAATHCSRYMEITPDGTRYTGWRLPTPAEIRVITGYQYGNIGGVTIPGQYQVLTPVLTGRYYWSLSGELILTRASNTEGNFLRCVRDLSAEEVEALNGFDKIQEKYR